MMYQYAAAPDIAAEIPDFPAARMPGCPFDPPPAVRAPAAGEPMRKVRLWDGSTSWLVSRYADQRALLADRRISHDDTLPGFPFVSAGFRARSVHGMRAFIAMDDPEHARLRRMVTPPFSIRRVEALRPRIQRIVDDVIDELLDGPRPVDLVQTVALPVPSKVICELLGVPYADHDFFQRRARALLSSDAPVDVVLAAQRDLVDYLAGVAGEKLVHPADDVLSWLAQRQVKTGGMSLRDVALQGTLLLIAGHETTANMIALGTLVLLQHPEQLAALRDSEDPAMIAGAVEELLRYLTIVHMGIRRVALADVEIAGDVIRAGDGIIFALNAGNRDERRFADPDRLDINRNARGHVAFGFGGHQCLGQPLARVELQVVYGTLYRRVPTLRVTADPSRLPFKNDSAVYGVYELPVTW
ncbi:MAG TPA: cytochrome P450 [Solirubrobacteraceae bacterium]|nr:cytochrome P450 [Solirubrobacteraceae bacterium]